VICLTIFTYLTRFLTILFIFLSYTNSFSDHHEHKHSHAEEGAKKVDEDIPAWKKQALEQGAGDPMALNWNVDNNKMEE
jgi:hypothetical protein